jgi:DNA-binding LacI/PurR family transcriptional regulator
VNSVRRPTLADVADAAGVSRSTASRALSDHPAVNAETRERVWEAARRLAFEPNHMARSLRTRSSQLIGMLLPDVGVASYASMLDGAQSVLEPHGYQVLVMNTGRNPEREQAALRTLYARGVDGMLVATSGGFVEGEVPTVFFDHVLAGRELGFSAADNAGGIAALVGHLVAVHGHKQIAYIGGPPEAWPGAARLENGSGTERLEAFRHAMGVARLPVVPEYVAMADHVWSQASGDAAARVLMALDEPPTAILAASDTIALGVLRALRELGRAVPADVALVCFDDPLDGDLIDPPITALVRHYRELGELAAGVLLDGLRGSSHGTPVELRVPLDLVVRRSCGCSI